MARKTIEQRLAELDAQRATLKARLTKQERANDTRRKVLLGALVLHRLENSNDPDFTKRLGDWLRREPWDAVLLRGPVTNWRAPGLRREPLPTQ